MAVGHGKDAYLSIDGDNLTTYLNSIDLTNSVDMAETSTMGLEAKTYISGLSDATLSFEGLFDDTATTGPHAVLNPLVGGETAVAFEYGPQGNGAGEQKISGVGFLSSYQVSASIGDAVAFSAEFQITGALTYGTFSA
jgi:hypothetical protein